MNGHFPAIVLPDFFAFFWFPCFYVCLTNTAVFLLSLSPPLLVFTCRRLDLFVCVFNFAVCVDSSAIRNLYSYIFLGRILLYRIVLFQKKICLSLNRHVLNVVVWSQFHAVAFSYLRSRVPFVLFPPHFGVCFLGFCLFIFDVFPAAPSAFHVCLPPFTPNQL